MDHGVSNAGAQGGMGPCVGLCLQEWVPGHIGSNSLVGPASPGPMNAPIHVQSRARGPECPKCQSPEGESLYLALKPCTESPHTKRVTSSYVLQRSRNPQLSIHGHSSAPSISHMPVCLAWWVPAALSVLAPSCSGRLPGRQTLWLTPLQTSLQTSSADLL